MSTAICEHCGLMYDAHFGEDPLAYCDDPQLQAVNGVPPMHWRQFMQYDPVGRPAHYVSHPSGIECIVVTEHMSFCAGNAVKYLWRAGLKKQPVDATPLTKHLEDLRKAAWYTAREIVLVEKQLAKIEARSHAVSPAVEGGSK